MSSLGQNPAAADTSYEADPDYFLPPTSGTAGNGLPIYNWDQAAQQLVRSTPGWNASFGQPLTITYAYRASVPSGAELPGGAVGFVPFNDEQIAAAELALREWADIANITFVRVNDPGSNYSNNATILFYGYTSGADSAAAFAFTPPGSTSSGSLTGDVFVNVSLSYNAHPVEGDYGPQVYLHEIGHALGLHHPGDYNAGAGTPTYPDSATYYQDARMYTVMSYFGSSGTGGSLNAYSSGPQLHDIAAIQLLYGANTATRSGDTVYGFNSNTGLAHFTITTATPAVGAGAVFSIWDGGGNDTLDLSGYTTSSEIDLRPESFSSAGPGNSGVGIAVGNISIARGVTIENAIGGSGDDTMIGNDVANRLTGGGGNDSLNGISGIDTAVYATTSTAASWHRNPDGSWTVSGAGIGTDTLTRMDFLDFTNRDVFLAPATHNFNADGVSDILWRSNAGTTSIWEFSSTQQITGAGGWNPGLAWTLISGGDFNGDGVNDVLWRHTDGSLSMWLLDQNAQPINGGNWFVNNAWSIAKTGDFNGDGTSDILWRNTDGTLSMWLFDANHNPVNGGTWFVPNDWTIQQAADFNSDGTTDLLWRSSAGSTVIWEFNQNLAITGAGGWNPGNVWSIAGTGDFNNDGINDVLWRHTDGTLSMWLLDQNAQPINGGSWFVTPDWSVAQVGDYNGDGISDILWRNTNGTLAMWLFDQNHNPINGGTWSAPTDWHII